MKKYFTYLILCLVTLFAGKNVAQASIIRAAQPGQSSLDIVCSNANATTRIRNCSVYVNITANDKIANRDFVRIGITGRDGIVRDSINVTAANGFRLTTDKSKLAENPYFILTSTTGPLTSTHSVGDRILVATLSYQIIQGTPEDGCRLTLGAADAIPCQPYTGANGTVYYYGPEGQLLSGEEEYHTLCDEKHICESANGKYYDINGNEVATEAAYLKSCFSCEKGSDNNYHGPNGEIVASEAEMNQLCFVCEIRNLPDGSIQYRGPVGQVLTGKEEYDELCNPICGTKDGKFYGKTGNEVESKEAMLKECYYCELGDDGNYHGKNGEILENELAMQKACFVCSTPTDEGTDGFYHGKDGRLLTGDDAASIWADECDKKAICYIDKEGNYYGKEGTLVSEETYKEQCGCRQEGGLYYNDNNVVISEEEFKNQCQKNPGTGSFIPYLMIGGGLALGAGAYLLGRNKSKLRRI